MALWVECSPMVWDLIPGRVIPKIKKMLLDASLLNSYHYKIRTKGKVKQSRERSSSILGVVVVENGVFGSHSTTVTNLTFLYIYLPPSLVHSFRVSFRHFQCLFVQIKIQPAILNETANYAYSNSHLFWLFIIIPSPRINNEQFNIFP